MTATVVANIIKNVTAMEMDWICKETIIFSATVCVLCAVFFCNTACCYCYWSFIAVLQFTMVKGHFVVFSPNFRERLTTIIKFVGPQPRTELSTKSAQMRSMSCFFGTLVPSILEYLVLFLWKKLSQ